MNEASIILIGYGNVGAEFHRLLARKSGEIRERYGISLSLRAALRSNAVWTRSEGSPLTECEDPRWRTGPSLPEILEVPSPGTLVLCTASQGRTGEPGLGIIRAALARGWHIVTADKGPLIAAWPELKSAADTKGKRLRISGATAAALPTLDVALGSLAGTQILSFEGVLNGTSNYILTRMEEGLDFASALAEAQNRGIAEPDPSQDVDGWDTAYKVLILTNAIVDGDYRPEDVSVQGIRNLPASDGSPAGSDGRKIKLVGRMQRTEGSVEMEVGPRALNPDHPLFMVDGTEKGISFATDSMGRITLIGGKSDPRGAAAALLKDLISIYADLP